MASPWRPGRFLLATPGFTPLRVRGHTWTSHPESGTFSWRLSLHTDRCLQVAGDPGPQQGGGLGCQKLPVPTVTQKGSDWPKEAHTRLPRLYRAAPRKATGLGASWGGMAQASLDLCPGTGALGHHPPHPGELGKSRSQHTQTVRRRSLGRQDGLSGRLMHLYSDQGKRERAGRSGCLVSDASVILAVHRAARTLTRSRALEPRSE